MLKLNMYSNRNSVFGAGLSHWTLEDVEVISRVFEPPARRWTSCSEFLGGFLRMSRKYELEPLRKSSTQGIPPAGR